MYVQQTRREVYESLLRLHVKGYVEIYETTAGWMLWCPHVGSWHPSSGRYKRDAVQGQIPPPRDAVLSCLTRLWGREAKSADGRSACPLAWGKSSRATGIGATNSEAVRSIFQEWAKRQQRPNACRLGVGAKRTIETALKDAEADQLICLIAFAYEADEPGPRYWRGANNQKRTYLGLDNLFRAQKLQERLQHALAWRDRAAKSGTGGDGTTFGPMHAYRNARKGPPGTTSRMSNQPRRISPQQREMVKLLVQRGDEGVLSSELAAIGLKYTSRISELRGFGLDVYVAERRPDGDNLYVLKDSEKAWEKLRNGMD